MVQVKRKPALAELLMPHILLDLAVYDEEDILCTRITPQLDRHVFSKPYPEPRIMSLFVSCFNHIRTFHLESLDTAKKKGKEEGAELLVHFQKGEQEPWFKVQPQNGLSCVSVVTVSFAKVIKGEGRNLEECEKLRA